jgi:hypothetical protein
MIRVTPVQSPGHGPHRDLQAGGFRDELEQEDLAAPRLGSEEVQDGRPQTLGREEGERYSRSDLIGMNESVDGLCFLQHHGVVLLEHPEATFLLLCPQFLRGEGLLGFHETGNEFLDGGIVGRSQVLPHPPPDEGADSQSDDQ